MTTIFELLTSFFGSIPAVVLSFSIIIQILVNLNINKLKLFKLNSPYALSIECGSILSVVLFLQLFEKYDHTFIGIFYTLPTGKFLKILLLIFSLIALPLIAKALFLQKINCFEYYTFFLITVLTSLLLISSYNYLHIYLLLEIQALSLYVLVALKRDSPFAVEAAVYYFVFNALISCLFLFSLLIIYSCCGTLNMFEIESIFACTTPAKTFYLWLTKTINIGILILSVSILAKVGVFPYHFWVVKVYEGAPLATTIIVSYLPKLVLFNLLIKICHSFNYVHFQIIWPLFLITGLGSIFVGSIFACFQTRIKRMLIYSSISQMGFPIIMFCFWGIDSDDIYRVIYLFVVTYLVLSLLSWSYYILVYQYFNRNEQINSEEKDLTPVYLSDLQNLYSSEKEFSFLSSLAFFSMAGIPPFAGFLAKVIIANELFTYNIYTIILIILFLSSISTFYYLQLVKIVFFEAPIKKETFFFTYFDNQFFSDSLYRYCAYSFIICLMLSVSQFIFFDFWLDYLDLVLNTSHSYKH